MIEEERLSITFGAPVPKEHLTFRNSLYGGPKHHACTNSTRRMDGLYVDQRYFICCIPVPWLTKMVGNVLTIHMHHLQSALT
jgi:hypothetical protein